MASGASYTTLEIVQTLPKPPDVPGAEVVPGGVLVPCTPVLANGVINRIEYRVPFDQVQGVALALRRITLEAPVFIKELDMPVQSSEETDTTLYKTAAEAKEAKEGKEGLEVSTSHTQLLGYDIPYEKIAETSTYLLPAPFGGVVLERQRRRTVERSLLPLAVTIVVRLSGPEGVLWTDSIDVPLHFLSGSPSAAIGTGTLTTYAEFTSPIPISPQKQYGLQFSVLVPSSASSNPQIGVVPGPAVGNGRATFFYDIETTSVGK